MSIGGVRTMMGMVVVDTAVVTGLIMSLLPVTMVQGASLSVADTAVSADGKHREKRSEPSDGRWSSWINSDRPWSGEGDFETTDSIMETQRICSFGEMVVEAQCRVAGSNDTFDSGSTAFLTDHLLQACSKNGLICLNNQQQAPLCQDYEVRFLCREMPSSDGSDSALFPNFDFKIYILLAVVPLFVITLRIIWSCCCKSRLKRQREGRSRRQRHGSLDSTASAASDESEASIDSSLANPPPAYADLFGSVPSHPVIFSISDGECLGCGKCLHHGHVTDVRGVNLAVATVGGEGGRGEERQMQEDGEQEEDGGTGSLQSTQETTHTTPSNADSGDVSVTSQNQTCSTRTVFVRIPSLASLGAAGLPVAGLDSPEVVPNTPCTCACHRRPSGQLNLAFHWGDNGDQVDASQPAVYPGMHKPVFSFSRIGSESSFTSLGSLASLTEPPNYEDALEILRKSGLFLDETKEAALDDC